MERIVLDKRA